jgi:hypothetical protein
MSQAIVDAIHQYPGWTMFCVVVLVLGIASGVESFLINVGKRGKK